jgi:hypothetical protein
MQALGTNELQAVSGGVMAWNDPSGMPDRTLSCGTMWLKSQMDRLFPTPR